MANNTSSQGMSYETKMTIVILLLLFVTPVGLILMWVWMKWPLWIKILLTVLPFLFTFLILGFVLALLGFIFSNPDVQKEMKRNISNEMSNIPSETSESPKYVDMTDWKTYTNTQYNFSLLYPPTLHIDENNSLGFMKKTTISPLAETLLYIPQGDQIFSITIYPNPQNLSATQWWEENFDNYYKDIKNPSTEKAVTKKDFVLSEKVFGTVKTLAVEDNMFQSSPYFIENGNTIIEIISTIFEKDQMIASFKFTQ